MAGYALTSSPACRSIARPTPPAAARVRGNAAPAGCAPREEISGPFVPYGRRRLDARGSAARQRDPNRAADVLGLRPPAPVADGLGLERQAAAAPRPTPDGWCCSAKPDRSPRAIGWSTRCRSTDYRSGRALTWRSARPAAGAVAHGLAVTTGVDPSGRSETSSSSRWWLSARWRDHQVWRPSATARRSDGWLSRPVSRPRGAERGGNRDPVLGRLSSTARRGLAASAAIVVVRRRSRIDTRVISRRS